MCQTRMALRWQDFPPECTVGNIQRVRKQSAGLSQVTMLTVHHSDSSFFICCTQAFRIHLYDTTASPYKQVYRYEDSARYSRYSSNSTTHLTSLKSIKTIQGRQGSWTITGEFGSRLHFCWKYADFICPSRRHFISRQSMDDLFIYHTLCPSGSH